MTVEYSWFKNDTPVKEGRKASFLHANEPGHYQCVVKVNDNIQKSAIINVVEVNDIPNSATGMKICEQSKGMEECDTKAETNVIKQCKLA